MSLSKNDYIFTFISILILFLLSWLLYGNINHRSRAAKNAQSIGTVTYKYHKVKRKFMDRFVWEKILPSTPVYLYDSVMTFERSDAIIRLEGGIEISLDPDTLVEIELIDDKVGIALNRGGLQSKNESSSFVIKTKDNTKIYMEKGNKSRIFSKNGKTSISVQKGKASIIDKNNNEKTLEENEILRKDKNGKWIQSEYKFTAQSPVDQSSFYMQSEANSKKVTFESDSSKSARYLLISKNPDMKNAQVYPMDKNRKDVSLSEGLWYWALSSEKFYDIADADVSPVKALKIHRKKEIKIYEPGNDTVYVQKNGEKTITFSWKAEKDNPLYEFQLSENESFNPVTYSIDTTNTSITLRNLKEGKYYWRLNEKHRKTSAKNPSGDTHSGNGTTHTFSIREPNAKDLNDAENEDTSQSESKTTEPQEKEISKIAPVLTKPAKGTRLYASEKLRLSWKKNPSASYYLITIKTSNGKVVSQKKQWHKNYTSIGLPSDLNADGVSIIIEAKGNKNQTIQKSVKSFALNKLNPPPATSIQFIANQ